MYKCSILFLRELSLGIELRDRIYSLYRIKVIMFMSIEKIEKKYDIYYFGKKYDIFFI